MANFFASLLLFCIISGAGEPMYWFDKIVVTASRIPEKLSNIPVGMTIITEKEIKESGANTLGEILRYEAGIDTRSYGFMEGVSSMSIRGSLSSQVLILLDGRPLNSVSLGMCDLSKIDLSDVKCIEIVKGPISSLYGANALGGVVNVITKTPKSRLEGTAYSGSYGTKIYTANVGIGNKRVGSSLSINRKLTNGTRSNSDLESISSDAKLSYRMNKHCNLLLSLGYNDISRGVPGPKPSLGFIPPYGDSTATSLFDRLKDRISFGDLSLNLIQGNITAHTKLFIDRREENSFMVYNDFFTAHKLEVNNKYLTSIFGMNGEVSFSFQLTKITLGIDTHIDEFTGISKIRDAVTATIDSTQWNPSNKTIGAWIEARGPLSGFLQIVPSLRYDYSTSYGRILSPSLGFVIALGKVMRLKLFAGRAFRAPTFNDLYWPWGGNKNLKPEFGNAYEIRLEKLFPYFLTSFSVFRRDVRDLIAWAPTEGGMWQPSNINRSETRGAEIEIETTTWKGMKAKLQSTYLSTKIKDNVAHKTKRAPCLPKLEASCAVSYKTDYGTDLETKASYTSDRIAYYYNGIKKIPSAFIVGITLNQRLLNYCTLFMKCNNLFNEKYAEQFGNSIYDRDYPQPGRNFKIGIKLTL